jgi:hypothetical protein
MRCLSRGRFGRIVSMTTAAIFVITTCLPSLCLAYATEGVPSPAPYGLDLVAVAPPAAVAVASAPTVVRELADKAGETKREYLLSDGNVRVEYYALPVNYRDADGDLKAIDVTLEATTAAGRNVAANKAAGFELQLPATLSGDWVSVSEGPTKVSLRPAKRSTKGVASVAGSIKSKASSPRIRIYENAFDGADLSYESRPDGVKETIVVAAPTSSTVYSFDLALEGLTPRLEKNGAIALVRGKSSAVEMTIPRPVMSDSAALGEECGDRVHYDLSGSGPIYRLDIVADAAWLSDPERVYPVTIDPSVITTTGATLDTHGKSTNPTYNYSGSQQILLNQAYSPGTCLGYVQPASSLASDIAAKDAAGYQLASIFHEGSKAFFRTRGSGRSHDIASASAPLLRR